MIIPKDGLCLQTNNVRWRKLGGLGHPLWNRIGDPSLKFDYEMSTITSSRTIADTIESVDLRGCGTYVFRHSWYLERTLAMGIASPVEIPLLIA